MFDITDDRIIRESFADYRSRDVDYMSAGRLVEFIECPLLFRQHELNPQPLSSPGMLMGTAAHTMILEGEDVFNSTYVWDSPINPATGKPYGVETKKFAEWANTQTKTPISDSVREMSQMLSAGVARSEHAQRLLSGVGIPEAVLRCEIDGRKLQGRLDYLSPDTGIIDLKTTEDLTWFHRDIERYRYVHKVAFYAMIVEHVFNIECVPVHIIAVERKDPQRCGVWRILPSTLSDAAIEVRNALDYMDKCRRANDWPTGFEELRSF